MAKVNVKVTMENGAGMGIFIRIDDQTLFFNRQGTQTVDLDPQFYIATVGGHEPSSAKVKIEFIQDGSVIGSQSFSTPTFFGFIPFTVS
jgi:hypothetical protein